MARELWETVTDLVEALASPPAASLGLRLRAVTVDLPTELVVVQTEVGFSLLLDAPHYRWDAGLRPQPGRLRLELIEMDEEEAAWITQFGGASAQQAPDGPVPDSPGGYHG